jgi:sulfite reductase (ferredoxin)
MTTLLPLPERVLKRVGDLRVQAARFRVGALNAEDFRAHRVPQGLYEQRTAGSYMLRVRLPGGLVTAAQARGLARLAADHGARLHLTTRQDLQFHELGLEAAVAIQEGLVPLGLSALGTGGNTVRNVTADPLAGVAADEAFDVRPHALAVTGLLLDRDGTDRLPRKFKVVFSGSDADRAGAAVADLGFIARNRAGEPGFLVLVGGGLGGRPALALTLTDWIPAADSLLYAEAICALFAARGDRANKATARLRHLRWRLGEAPFLELCREAVTAQRRSGPAGPVPALVAVHAPPARPASALPAAFHAIDGVVPERDAGRVSLRFAPILGDLAPAALVALADAAQDFASPLLRAGLDQELWLTGVAGGDVPDLLERLAAHQVGAPGAGNLRIPACAGAATCKLGLLRSRGAASAIAAQLAGAAVPLLDLRISGCPNSCGRHLVAGLGFEGKVRRVNGRLLPCYEVFVGGRHGAAGASLGRRLGAVPAKRLPAFVAAVAKGRLVDADAIQPLVAEHAALPVTVPEDWFTDWDDQRPFSLAGLGQGECAVDAPPAAP